jgi:hypothetical protein
MCFNLSPRADACLLGSIERMLNLNHDSEESSNGHQDHGSTSALTIPSVPILNEDGDPIWKVLVFDDLGRDVISSVLRVNDLRTWGVTMHMYVPQDGLHNKEPSRPSDQQLIKPGI